MPKKLLYILFVVALAACKSGGSLTKDEPYTLKNGKVLFTGEPWVKNASKPFSITSGLNNRHLSLSASHGRYYDVKKGVWKWQRPYLFCTTEDLFTQSILYPFLIPMLQDAGAVVFSPRERDPQRQEIIVDNDDRGTIYYKESALKGSFRNAKVRGYGVSGRDKSMTLGVNPFSLGTARQVKTAPTPTAEVSYQPDFKEGGKYSVYVSYPTLRKSVRDAAYTVYHQGRKTLFTVNQRMGGSTWVYLGEFVFDKGCSKQNRVVLQNMSRFKGVVATDAVRFGGGMGVVERGGSTSGLPKCLEGAKYYAQTSGMPTDVYNRKGGSDDYSDDINTRSLMTNHIAGGSCFAPKRKGKGLNVPIELSLALHSDAGVKADFKSQVGSLVICTTNFNDHKLANNEPRTLSKEFAQMLLDGFKRDLSMGTSQWQTRGLWDKNYSETRLPDMTSVIVESLSHQNFPDMALGQEPMFKYLLSRSIYKTILKFLSHKHDTPYVVSPLPVRSPFVKSLVGGEAIISWQGVSDSQEPTAKPTAYVVYVAMGKGGYDNGTRVTGTSCRLRLQPNTLYKVRISAVNAGGESFKSEVLPLCYVPNAKRTIMIVNGFHRLSPPRIVDNDTEQGFDLGADIGVSYGDINCWSGKQLVFQKQRIGDESEQGLGFSGNEWEGRIFKGNDFDAAVQHAEVICQVSNCNVLSCSSYAVEQGLVGLQQYDLVDLVLGLEKSGTSRLKDYKTFPLPLRNAVQAYVSAGGNLLASGAFLASDMRQEADKAFLKDVLSLGFGGTVKPLKDDYISTANDNMTLYNMPSQEHYAAQQMDILQPTAPAFGFLRYSTGDIAAVASAQSGRRTIAVGFPLECLKDVKQRLSLMRGILKFFFP